MSGYEAAERLLDAAEDALGNWAQEADEARPFPLADTESKAARTAIAAMDGIASITSKQERRRAALRKLARLLVPAEHWIADLN